MQIENISKKIVPDKSLDKSINTGEEQMLNNILTNEAVSALEKENPRMAEVIRYRYIQGMTQLEVSKLLKVTPTRIGQMEEEALKKLRRFLTIRIKKPLK